LAGFPSWFLVAGFSLMYGKISQNRMQGATRERFASLLSEAKKAAGVKHLELHFIKLPEPVITTHSLTEETTHD
jgi:hypothetical protein